VTGPPAAARETPSCARLRGVERRYDRRDGEVTALDAVDLDIARGELLALTGPSGSGKSTLLHVLGLLDTPTAGQYWLDGEDVSSLEDDDRSARRNEKIGFVFQAFHLVPHLTLQENVALPLVYRGVAENERRTRAAAALCQVGVGHRLEHLPDEVSGGEQQRAAIARALVHEPPLLLADEPTGNLDEQSAESVLELVRSIHDGGTTIVLVTHNPRVAALAERVREIRHGRLV